MSYIDTNGVEITYLYGQRTAYLTIGDGISTKFHLGNPFGNPITVFVHNTFTGAEVLRKRFTEGVMLEFDEAPNHGQYEVIMNG